MYVFWHLTTWPKFCAVEYVLILQSSVNPITILSVLRSQALKTTRRVLFPQSWTKHHVWLERTLLVGFLNRFKPMVPLRVLVYVLQVFDKGSAAAKCFHQTFAAFITLSVLALVTALFLLCIEFYRHFTDSTDQ